MNIYERQDFRNRYGIAPETFSKALVGQKIIANGYELKLLGIRKSKGYGMTTVEYTENGIHKTLDMQPHWERGKDGPIKTNHHGAMNLIYGVYRQTANDLEKMYAYGVKGMEDIDRYPGENANEFRRRCKELFKIQLAECENFLGTVLSREIRIKALFQTGVPVSDIATEVGMSEKYVWSVIDRLGFMRSDSPDSDNLE